MRNQMNFVEFPPVRCNNLIAGISAVIGIIGGVYLITKTTNDVISKITNRKKKQSNENEFFCNVCCAEIDPEDDKTFVKCYICQKYICRSIKCADWLPKTAEWECELCQTSKESLAQTSSWVADQISFHQEKLIHPPRARSEIYIPISECNDSSIHFESVSQIGANSATITAEQKLKIREYVEEVVAKLLGGNLDTIAVNQLSKSENYLNLFHKYHSKLSNILINLENVLTFYTHNHGDLPDPKNDLSHNGISGESVRIRASNNDFTDISETRLRQMIQKIIAETISLPPLSKSHAVSEIALDRRSKASDNRPLANGCYPRHRTEHYFEPTIYQDLLATAVLNKIVDKQLNNNHEITETDTGGGGGDEEGEDVNDNIRLAESDQNFNIEKLSTTSGSSVEPRSDCSYPEAEQLLNTNDDKSSELIRNSDRDSVMSDYLASHLIPLPDLNAIATESEEEDYMSVTSSAIGDGTWETNWLFKKKKSGLGSSVTTNSVGMLVPDPKEDVRAQIGDKTADEVSDLSELGSDTDDSLDSLRSKLEPINDRLANKHLIGGQNNKMVLDELIERSSMISNTLQSNQDILDACNEHVIDAPTKTEAINDNVTQQDITLEQNGPNLRGALCSVVLEDQNSNSLAASDDTSESDGCIGFSAIEIIEPTPDTPSVVEILAAMALGPMLAVPTLDQPATLTVSDFNVFTDLKELALAEIKARSLELTPRNLDVIPEETVDVINQTDNVIDSKNMTTLDETELSENETIVNSPELSSSISELNQQNSPETKESSSGKSTNEIISHLATLTSTKFISGNSHLNIDENTDTELLPTEEILSSDKERTNEQMLTETQSERCDKDISDSPKHEILSSDLESNDHANAEMHTNNDNLSECLQSNKDPTQQGDVIRKQESSEMQLQDDSDSKNTEDNSNPPIPLDEPSKTEDNTPKEYSKELDKTTPNFENKTEETLSNESINEAAIHTEHNEKAPEEQSSDGSSKIQESNESLSEEVQSSEIQLKIESKHEDNILAPAENISIGQSSEPHTYQSASEEPLSTESFSQSQTIDDISDKNSKVFDETNFNEENTPETQTEQNVNSSEEQSAEKPQESEVINKQELDSPYDETTAESTHIKEESTAECHISKDDAKILQIFFETHTEPNKTILEEQLSGIPIECNNSDSTKSETIPSCTESLKTFDDTATNELSAITQTEQNVKPTEELIGSNIPPDCISNFSNTEFVSTCAESSVETKTENNISTNSEVLVESISQEHYESNETFLEEQSSIASNLQSKSEDNVSTEILKVLDETTSKVQPMKTNSDSPISEASSSCTEFKVESNTENETISREKISLTQSEEKIPTESNLDSLNNETGSEGTEIKVELETNDNISKETAKPLNEIDLNKQSLETLSDQNIISSEENSSDIAEKKIIDSSNSTAKSECTELKIQFNTEDNLSYSEEQSSDMTLESKSVSPNTKVTSNTECDILIGNSKLLDETICIEKSEAQTEEETLESKPGSPNTVTSNTECDILIENSKEEKSEAQTEVEITTERNLDSSSHETIFEVTDIKVESETDDNISKETANPLKEIDLNKQSSNPSNNETGSEVIEASETQNEQNVISSEEKSSDIAVKNNSDSSSEDPSACREFKVECEANDDIITEKSKGLHETISREGSSEAQTEENITTESNSDRTNHETGSEVVEIKVKSEADDNISNENLAPLNEIALNKQSSETQNEQNVISPEEKSSEKSECTELKIQFNIEDNIPNENSEISDYRNSQEQLSTESNFTTEIDDSVTNKNSTVLDKTICKEQCFETQTEQNITCSEEHSSDMPLDSSLDSPNSKDPSAFTEFKVASNTECDILIKNSKGIDEIVSKEKSEAQTQEKITTESNLDSVNIETVSDVTEITVELETNDIISNENLIRLNEIVLKVQFSETQTEQNLISSEKIPSNIPMESNSDSPKDEDKSEFTESNSLFKSDNNIPNENSNVSNETISQERSSETQTEQNERISGELDNCSESNLKTKIDDNVINENLKVLVETISKEQCFETQTEQDITFAEEQSSNIAESQNSEAVSNTEENIANVNSKAFDERISEVNSSESHAEENKTTDIPVNTNLNPPDNKAPTDSTEITVESETDDNISNEIPKPLNEIISKEQCLERQTEQIVEKSSDIALESNSDSIKNEAELTCPELIVESKSNENLKVLDETISQEQFSETKTGNIEKVLEKDLFTECQVQSDNLKALDDETISQEQYFETKIDQNETVLKEQLSAESNLQSKTNSNICDKIVCHEQHSEIQSEIVSEQQLSTESDVNTKPNDNISNENAEAPIETTCKDQSFKTQIEQNTVSSEEQSCDLPPECDSEFKAESNTKDDVSNENSKTDEIILIEQSTETQSNQNVISSEEKSSDLALDNKSDSPNNGTESAVSKTEVKIQIEENVTSFEKQSCEIPLESNSESLFIEAVSACTESIVESYNTNDISSEIHDENISEEQSSIIKVVPAFTESIVESNTTDDISNEIHDENISEEHSSESKENTATGIPLESNSDSANNEFTSEIREIKVESNIDDCISNENSKPPSEINLIQQSSVPLAEGKDEALVDNLNSTKSADLNIASGTEHNISNENFKVMNDTISEEQSPDTQTERNEAVLEEHVCTESNLQSKTEDIVLNENLKALNETISKEQSHKTLTETTVKSSEEPSSDISLKSTSDLPSFTPSNENSKYLEEIISEERYSEDSANTTTNIPMENNSDSTNNEAPSQVTEIKVESKTDNNISNEMSKQFNAIILTKEPLETQTEQMEEKSPDTALVCNSDGIKNDAVPTCSKIIESKTENISNENFEIESVVEAKTETNVLFEDSKVLNEEQSSETQAEPNETVLKEQLSTQSDLQSKIENDLSNENVKELDEPISKEQSLQSEPTALSSEEKSVNENSDAQTIKNTISNIPLESNLDSMENEVTEIKVEFNTYDSITNESSEALNILTESPKIQTEQNILCSEEKSAVGMESNSAVPSCTETIIETKIVNNISNENSNILDETISREQLTDTQTEQNESVSEEHLCTESNLQYKTEEAISNENLKAFDKAISEEQNHQTHTEPIAISSEEQSSDIPLKSNSDLPNIENSKEIISEELFSEACANTDIPQENNSDSKNKEAASQVTEIKLESKQNEQIEEKSPDVVPTCSELIVDSKSENNASNENLNVLDETVSQEQFSEIKERIETVAEEELPEKDNIQSKTDDENIKELDETISLEHSSETQTKETETVLKEQLSTESNIQSKTEDNVSNESFKVLDENISEEQIPKTLTEQNATSSEDRLCDILQESHVDSPNNEVPISSSEVQTTDNALESNSDSTNNEVAEINTGSISDDNVSNKNSKPLNEIILTEQSPETHISPNVISLEEKPSDIALESNSDSTKREEVLERTEPIVEHKAENNISDENSNILDDTISQQQYSETNTQQNNSVSEEQLYTQSNLKSRTEDNETNENLKAYDEIICKEQATDTQTLKSTIFLGEQSSDIPLESNTDSLNIEAAPACTEFKVESKTSNENLKCLDETISEEKFSEANENSKVPIETISQEQSYESKIEHDETFTEDQLSAESNVLESNLDSITNESPIPCRESIEEKSFDILNIISESSNMDAVSKSKVDSKSKDNLPNAVIDEQSSKTRGKNEKVSEELLSTTVSQEVTSETRTENTVTFLSEHSSDIALESNSNLLNTETVSESKTEDNIADENSKILPEKNSQENSSETHIEQIKTVVEEQLSTEHNLQLKTDDQLISHENLRELGDKTSPKEQIFETLIDKNETLSTEESTKKQIDISLDTSPESNLQSKIEDSKIDEYSIEPKEKTCKEQAEQNERSSVEHLSDIQMHCISELTNSEPPSACSESITEVLDKINSDLESGLNEKNSAEQTSEITVDINLDSTKSNDFSVSSESNVQIKTEDNISNETKSDQNEIISEEHSSNIRLENNIVNVDVSTRVESEQNEKNSEEHSSNIRLANNLDNVDVSTCVESNTESKNVDNISNESSTEIDVTICKPTKISHSSTKEYSEMPIESNMESKMENNEQTEQISELPLEEQNEIVSKEKPLEILQDDNINNLKNEVECSQSNMESTVEYPHSNAFGDTISNEQLKQSEIVTKDQSVLQLQNQEDLKHKAENLEVIEETISTEPSAEMPQPQKAITLELNFKSKTEDSDSDIQKTLNETISSELQIKTNIHLTKQKSSEIKQEEISGLNSEDIISNKDLRLFDEGIPEVIITKQSSETPQQKNSDSTNGESLSPNDKSTLVISCETDATAEQNKIVLIEIVCTKESSEKVLDNNSDCTIFKTLSVSSESYQQNKIEDNASNENLRNLDEIIPKGLSSETCIEENKAVVEKQSSEIPGEDNLECTSTEVLSVCLETNVQLKVEDNISNVNSQVLTDNSSKDQIVFKQQSSEIHGNSDSTHNESLCACFESKSQCKSDDELVQENSDQNVLLGCFPRVLCPCLEPNKQSKTYEDTSICKHIIGETRQNEVTLKQESSEIPLEVISNSKQCLESCVPTIENKSSANNDKLPPNSEAKTEDNSTEEDSADIQLQNNDQYMEENSALSLISESKTDDNSAGKHSFIVTETVEKKNSSNNDALCPHSESTTEDNSAEEHSLIVTGTFGNEQPKTEQEYFLSANSEAKTDYNSVEEISITLNENIGNEQTNNEEESSSKNKALCKTSEVISEINSVEEHSTTLTESVGNEQAKIEEKTYSQNDALSPNSETKADDSSAVENSTILTETVKNEQPNFEKNTFSQNYAMTEDNLAEGYSIVLDETIVKESPVEVHLQQNEIVSKEHKVESISNKTLSENKKSNAQSETVENILDKHSKTPDEINSNEESGEIESTQIIILSSEQTAEIAPNIISNTKDILEEVGKSPVPPILSEASEAKSTTLVPDVRDKPVELAVSLDDSPTISRQTTVVKIENEDKVEEVNNKAADSIVSATNQPPGNHNITKKLQRQCRVEDTTPSFEDVSPQSLPQTTPPSTLAGLCQKFIHDKHLLNALENRRRRTLLMHRFLSTLDLSNSTDDSMEEANKVHTEVLVTENPVVCESFTLSHDHDSDYEDCSDSFIFEINDLDKISYNFINNILFSDQLSHDSKPSADSRTNTIEEYIDNENDEKDILAFNFNNNSTTNPTTTIITTTPPTNLSTEIRSKAYTTNNPNNKTNNHKQPITIISDDPTRTTTNQKHQYDLLTSAVQNKETSNSNSQCVQQFINNDQVNLEILTDDNGHNGIHVGVDDGANRDEEEDDDVAILRHFVPGSIAEREYKKWYNAVEMPNNPYAPEALKRRISGSQERFIDLPNISPTNDLNTLELLNNQKLDEDENTTRESDYKRYSRDYYINGSLTTPQTSPARDVSARETKDIREPAKKTLSSKETETEIDLYKAIPAQVVENNSSSTDSMPLLSAEIETNTTTTSDDSDTIKIYDFQTQQETKTTIKVADREQATVDDVNSKERPCGLAFSRSESGGNIITPTRGATPQAFKFLQPKRKLLEPSQVLSVEEDESQVVSSPSDKPVIEADVVKALPSVKALARAFLMTTNTTQPEKLWLRKARTLSQGGKKRSCSPKRSLDHIMRTEQLKPEDDLTITSDLSSLETDSSSVGVEIATSSDLTSSAISSKNDPSLPADTSNISPVPVRQGVLKNNIAFFENLKNK
ncbi:titin isoform X3 [Lucilia sericata]|uniref:titin isoform X3 n=1 Tax=Lucilia sericata TaxID=13632 RepID=UPI0018A83691|nr:titin isoform X3 [Lucilia sericata]